MTLYTEATSWWSLADHAVVLDVLREIRPRTVLEFGPGSSTLSLIEGGAARIDCAEDDEDWLKRYRQRLEKRFPDVVRMLQYTWSPLPKIDGALDRYDLALIDGPRETKHRAAVFVYAMERCAHVLVPLECAQGETFMRKTVERFAGLYKRHVRWIEDTGPMAGAFALVAPPC